MASVPQGAFNLDLSDKTKVTIDEGSSSTNNVAITIKNSGVTAKIRVTVSFKCGTMPDALMMAKDAPLKLVFQATGKKAQDLTQASTPGQSADWLSWETPSKGFTLDAGDQLSISISHFESNTVPGNAPLTVVVRTLDASSRWVPLDPDSVPDANKTLTITKTAIKTDAPTVRYFAIDPDFIVHAGDSKVTMGFYATGIDSVVLFRNNQEVKNWQTSGADGVSGSFDDKPSITTVYRLQAKPKDTAKDTIVVYRTVQVISPGWNQLALPQGYPARLFVDADYTPGQGGAQSQRLYGIFIDGGVPALYSSATGVDDWRREPDDVPPAMAMSPGVAYNNKLWLIGGSCVNWKKTSSDVWCYEPLPDDPTLRAWRKKKTVGGDLPARMGHACIVTQGQLWVLGGYQDPNPFNDVWQLTEDEAGNVRWNCLSAKCAWSGRMNLAATQFNDGNTQGVWIYAGSAGPQTPAFYDLWSTQDGINWTPQANTVSPDPGLPIGATLTIYPGSGEDRLLLMGSFLQWAGATGNPGNRVSSSIFEWHAVKEVWEERPVVNGWQQFHGDNFYMQAVTFNGFLFVWSLQPDIHQILKFNVLIS